MVSIVEQGSQIDSLVKKSRPSQHANLLVIIWTCPGQNPRLSRKNQESIETWVSTVDTSMPNCLKVSVGLKGFRFL
jgi:hypothetical protein